VVGAELGPAQPQRLLHERQGLLELSSVQVARRQVIHGGERAGVVEAELGLSRSPGFLEHGDRLGREAQAQERLPEPLLQRRDDQ